MTAPVLSDSTFRLLGDLICEKTGINIPAGKKYLVENRLLKLIEEYNLKGYDDLLYLVKYGANGTEMLRLYDAITTNETYFFREPHHFDLFIDEIVPKAIENKGGVKIIRVWSAACSTGEEPYTLSMMLMEKRPDVFFDVIASDISGMAVASAQRGLYGSYSVRNVPEHYLKKYFKPVGQEYELDRSVRNAVKFRIVNLIDRKKMSEMGAVDIIFCRNVLIYFSDKARQDTVSYLYDALRPGGMLFIGTSESLHNVTRAFRPVTMRKTVVYQRV